jgi:hypothetical protein
MHKIESISDNITQPSPLHDRLLEETHGKNDVDTNTMITYPPRLLGKALEKSATKKMALPPQIPVLALPYKYRSTVY